MSIVHHRVTLQEDDKTERGLQVRYAFLKGRRKNLHTQGKNTRYDPGAPRGRWDGNGQTDGDGFRRWMLPTDFVSWRVKASFIHVNGKVTGVSESNGILISKDDKEFFGGHFE